MEFDFELSSMIDLCKTYNGLGWAVQEQLDKIMSGGSLEDCNPNALYLIKNFVELTATDEGSELEARISEYLLTLR